MDEEWLEGSGLGSKWFTGEKARADSIFLIFFWRLR